jgi:tRNA pseudouridine38-40 synthase
MRRILLKIAYDGTNYHGWQVQKNASSVQETLQDAMEKIFASRPDLHGCSRTDSGVHANEYYCHFDVDNNIPCNQLVRALNTYLPSDISVSSAEDKDINFHARYSAKSKEYLYKIYNCQIPNPFYDRYCLQVAKSLDVDRMNRVAQNFTGTHDFKGFCSIKTTAEDTIRTIYDCKVEKSDNDKDIIEVKISGDGFLYNMVRIIVGTLLFVEFGNIDEKDIPDIIKSGDRKRAGKTISPKGLYLNKVEY